MNKIKEIRQSQNYTQAVLAKMLNTTQQTIQRWESGKTNIPSSALKDLAMVLNCPIDEILGTSDISRTLYPTVLISHLKNRDNIIAHYGGITLNLSGIKEDLDYPVDEQAAESIYRQLPNASDQYSPISWMHFESMDNYVLFINLKALKRANLYSDDHEVAPVFFNPEVYRILLDWDEVNPELANSEIAEHLDISETLVQVVKDIVKEYTEINKNWNSWEHCHYCKIYWIDEEVTSHYIDEKLYWDLSDLRMVCHDPDINPEAHLGERFIKEEMEGGYTNFLNLSKIAAIEVPAIKYWQVACQAEPDLLEIRDYSVYMPPKKEQDTD